MRGSYFYIFTSGLQNNEGNKALIAQTYVFGSNQTLTTYNYLLKIVCHLDKHVILIIFYQNQQLKTNSFDKFCLLLGLQPNVVNIL